MYLRLVSSRLQHLDATSPGFQPLVEILASAEPSDENDVLYNKREK